MVVLPHPAAAATCGYHGRVNLVCLQRKGATSARCCVGAAVMKHEPHAGTSTSFANAGADGHALQGRVASRGETLVRKRCGVDSSKPSVDLEDAALVGSAVRLFGL